MKVDIHPVFTKCATCKYWSGKRDFDENMQVIVEEETIGKCSASDSENAGLDVIYDFGCNEFTRIEEIEEYFAEQENKHLYVFSTGYFRFLNKDGFLNVSERGHYNDFEWDDCVIDRDFDWEIDGYVSNMGMSITIHIKQEYMSEEYINIIKYDFGLFHQAIQKVEVQPMNVDIFDLFHLSSKEDIYTFCLKEFLERSREFRAHTAAEWGFPDSNEDYHVFRGAIYTDQSDVRNKIIPDLILCNNSHVAVIESKMYSSEGYSQTIDYEKATEDILNVLSEKEHIFSPTIDFYYFTLLGVKSSSDKFKVKKWADYYTNVLSNFSFEDPALELIRNTILQRAISYKDFENNYKNKQYGELTNNPNSWISPCSLFSAGLLDAEWKMDSNKFSIYSGTVHGSGHSTFRTDFYNKDNCLIENLPRDNIWLFTRVEWNNDSVDLFVNWEYWERDNDGKWIDYIPFSKLDEAQKTITKEDKSKCIEFLRERLDDNICIPPQKANMLHILKASVKTEYKTIGQLIDELRQILLRFEEYKSEIFKNLTVKDGYIRFM